MHAYNSQIIRTFIYFSKVFLYLNQRRSHPLVFGWTSPSEVESVLRFNMYTLHSFRRNVSAKNKSYHNSSPPLINRHFHIIIIFKLHVFDQHFRLYTPLLQTLPKHVSSQQLICYFIDEKTKT